MTSIGFRQNSKKVKAAFQYSVFYLFFVSRDAWSASFISGDYFCEILDPQSVLITNVYIERIP